MLGDDGWFIEWVRLFAGEQKFKSQMKVWVDNGHNPVGDENTGFIKAFEGK